MGAAVWWVVLGVGLALMVVVILFFQGARILEERIRRAENPEGGYEEVEITVHRRPKQLVLPFPAPLEPDLAYSRIGRLALAANLISELLSRVRWG